MIHLLRRLCCRLTGQPLRSARWPAVRAAHLLRQPTCKACGGRKRLEVHHLYPVHFPGGDAVELEPANLLTLCRPCHLTVGHGGDWKAVNPTAALDADRWLTMIRGRTYPPRTVEEIAL
jgi:5-methylcytosine-specific restriction endonuclease McrA